MTNAASLPLAGGAPSAHSTATSRQLLIVDGSHLLHRSCHTPAYEKLATRTGVRTGGAFGFLASLRATLDKGVFVKCIVAWDHSMSQRRLSLFPEYKANRAPDPDKPEDVQAAEEYRKFYKFQKYFLAQVLTDLGVREVTIDGYEGDDVVYRLAQAARDQFTRTLVLSEDRDFLQLVDVSTDLYRPIEDAYITLSNFTEHAKVTLARFLLFKSLDGDKNDGITGIPKVGTKTALQVANEYPYDGDEWSPPTDWDWGKLTAFCAEHKSKRVNHVAEGISVVQRNFKLIDLRQEPMSQEVIDQLISAVGEPCMRDLQEVMRKFSKVEFTRFLENFASWSVPFKALQ